MNHDLVVCLGCRTRTPAGIDGRTLRRDGELLTCACGARYPIVAGVPIVVDLTGSYMQREIATIVERDLPLEVAAALAAHGPDEAPYPRLLEHVSVYLDAHWGDRADPPDGYAVEPLRARIAARATERVAMAVELGCSAGRITAELAAGADHAIGLDLQFGTIRRARALLDGETVRYGRRICGRTYAPVTVTAGDLAVPATRRTLICGDALDPPLMPGTFQRVVALNLIDSVRSPRQLLAVIDGLCARGGEVILSSPYAWQSNVVDDRERLGGDDPATELVRILTEGDGLSFPYVLEDEAELAWTLRRDARSTVCYRTHYLRARKA